MTDEFVIDFFEHDLEELRRSAPKLLEIVINSVKPERDANRRESYSRLWWVFGEPRRLMRPALVGLARFVVTVRTAKHRVFQFLAGGTIPESKLVVIASADAFILGCLSSRPHVVLADVRGGWLGVGNDSTYNHSDCFEAFPFPACADTQKAQIQALGESLDAHRKRQQALHPDLTITGMYNVLEKLRSGEALTAKEKVIHEQGLVSVLKQIHDDLDGAVFDAYGWPRDLADEQILEHLVALNRERAEEEKNGLVRWLRPEFQNPTGAGKQVTQGTFVGTEEEEGEAVAAIGAVAPWPKKLPAQIAAVRDLLRGTSRGYGLDDVLRAFKGAKKKDAEAVLESLAALGLLSAFDVAGERRWRAEGRVAA